MEITIIGAGSVGAALGENLASRDNDYEIVYGVRAPDDAKYAALKESTGATFVTVAEAVQNGEIIILATPWGVTKDVIEQNGPWDEKLVIDCTNPIAPDFSGLEVGHTTSGAEMIAKWAAGADVVKCFNHTGAENMRDPVYDGEPISMFVAGDNPMAVAIVAKLAEDVGFEVITLDSLTLSRQLEQLAWLWIHMAIKEGRGRDIALRFVTR